MSRNRTLAMHIFPAFIITIIFVSLFIYLSSASEFKRFYNQDAEMALKNRATIFASNLDAVASSRRSIDSLAIELGKKTDTRFTVINIDGVVIADSRKRPSIMDNHGDRPEVKEAIKSGVGQSIRYSQTLKTNLMYVAIKSNDNIIRASIPLTQYDVILKNFKIKIFKGVIVAIVLAIILSYLLTRTIVTPIEELKLRAKNLIKGEFKPISFTRGSSEIIELSKIMESSSKELSSRMSRLSNEKDRLNTVLSEMIEGVIVFNHDEKIYLINDAAREMLSVDIKDVKNHLIQEVVRHVPFQEFVNDVINNRGVHDTDIRVFNGSNDTTLSVNGRILKNGGAIVVIHDITTIKKLESLRREFVANVSHELRTPLTSIKGFVETLSDGAVDSREDAVKFLNIINRQVDKLNNLIEDLLTISRIEKEEDRGDVSFVKADLSSILDTAISQCEKRAEEASIEIKKVSDKSAYANVVESLLEQSFINLIDNAIKYSGPGAVLSIGIENSGNFIDIRFSDNGVGIGNEHLSRIFERFYRVDKARSSSVGGTGLGLSIVKHIATLHNGSVGVSSKLGEGTQFKILLPKIEISRS